MMERSAVPLPPVRSRRMATATVTVAEGTAREPAPLPPYVPGRAVAVAAPPEPALLPEEEASLAAAEAAPIELADEAAGTDLEGAEVAPSFDPGESWIVGAEDDATADEDSGWVVTGMGEAWESGEGYPFEAATVEPEASAAAEPETDAEAAPAATEAFPWELPSPEPEPELEAGPAAELAPGPAADVSEEALDDVLEALSPWEELREAAAQSIAVPDEAGVTASLGIEAATESADTLAAEFAQRLEALAERLRHEGLRAIDRTLAEGDRLDAAVAGFLTGYLAARDE